MYCMDEESKMFTRSFSKERRPFGDPVEIAKQNVRFEPPPFTNLVNLNLPLDIVLPGSDQQLALAQKMVFHTVGDTGGINDGGIVQTAIAEAMEAQIQTAAPADKPLFFYHLGDVVYFNGESSLYPEQFYEPYKHYPAPIFAIPGNHDGDTHVRPGDAPDGEKTLTGFIQNFCDSQPHHNDPYRETMTQPYVYWTLDTPCATMIGLYSNVEGLLDGRGTYEQQRWLEGELQNAPTDRPVILAVHHPPYSLDTAHGGYPDIGTALDRAMRVTGRNVDIVFSGHVHSYQRFTRVKDGGAIPYIVAGAGGYAHSPRALHQLQTDDSNNPIQLPFNTLVEGVSLQAYQTAQPGYMRITITAQTLVGEYFTVPFNGPVPAAPVDTFTLDWKNHAIT
jgi:hypothetical protein